MRRTLLLTALAALTGCGGYRHASRDASPSRVLTGLEVLERRGFDELRGKRVGLITNHTGKDASGRSAIEILGRAENLTLAAVFAPEHGLAGLSEEVKIGSGSLTLDGRAIPVHSLYAGGPEGMRPRQDDLAGLDTLVFDIQDVGARFYTYLSTMGMALEEAKKAGLDFVVLDRPNPINGVSVEGPMLAEGGLKHQVITAYFPVPIRHGMTAGEIARLHNAAVGASLQVVPMAGWKRSMWFDETGLPWTKPSPNMPDLEAAALYPGVACLEFTNMSVGRGTDTPFGWLGAPWLDAEGLAQALQAEPIEGVEFSAERRTPSKSVFAGVETPGLRITLKRRDALRPLALFAYLVTALRDRHPDRFQLKWEGTRKLVGNAEFKRLYDRGASARDIIALFDEQSARFMKERAPYLLYK
jgi:uncharacterized protein YbbC (DUF1343 family)